MKERTSVLLAAEDSDKASLNGTIYRKQIARFGKWVNPMYPYGSEDRDMILDKAWADEMIANFKKKVIDRVPVPVNHTDDTSANAGEVIKLELSKDGSGLDAYIDVRRTTVVEEIENGLIFDVSMSFDWDYVDTENGTHHGITLLHVALVNNPYLTKMKPFETVKEAIDNLSRKLIPTALANSNSGSVIMLSETKAKELNAMDATVKNDKDFEVKITVKNEEGEEVEKTLASGEETTVPQDQAEAVLKQIQDAEAPKSEDDGEGDDGDEGEGGEGSGDGEGEGEGEGSGEEEGEEDDDEKTELSRTKAELARYKVQEKYNTLLSAGKITPAQKDKFMALSEVSITGSVKLSNGKNVDLASLVTGILEAGPARVKFSEDGSGKENEGDEGEEGNDEDKKPSETLSKEELAGLKATGITPERMDELAESNPAFKDALEKMNKNKKGDK